MTQESTHIAKVMSVTDRKIRCDAAAKQVLSNKDILAIILREVVPEFKNCDKDFIKSGGTEAIRAFVLPLLNA